MLDIIFTNLLIEGFTFNSFMFCTLTSIVLGLIIALVSKVKSHFSPGFSMTVGILPLIVQVVIMLVNGNIGVGVAVAGAFSLVRFRSAPGSAKEIMLIFLVMTVGLACGIGYIGIAIILTVISLLLMFLYLLFFKTNFYEKDLQITIPESLNYTEAFDDLFAKYTKSAVLFSVKTTNMGSLYKLKYRIILKDSSKEKEFIDQLRCRNGNLEIMCQLPVERTSPEL